MIARILAIALAGALASCATQRGTREVYAPRDRPATRPADGSATSAPAPYTSTRDPSEFARTAEEISGPAVLSLLDQARDALAEGRPEQAVVALETALDIDKRNPFVWQQLAVTHLQRNLPEDAEMVAQRSNSFAHGNPWIELENWRVIAAARDARGDPAGAQQARDRMIAIQDFLDD